MTVVKLFILALLIMPFIFACGIMLSSAEESGIFSICADNSNIDTILSYGRQVESISRDVVYAEIAMAKKLMRGISERRHNNSGLILNRLKRFTRRDI